MYKYIQDLHDHGSERPEAEISWYLVKIAPHLVRGSFNKDGHKCFGGESPNSITSLKKSLSSAKLSALNAALVVSVEQAICSRVYVIWTTFVTRDLLNKAKILEEEAKPAFRELREERCLDLRGHFSLIGTLPVDYRQRKYARAAIPSRSSLLSNMVSWMTRR